MFYCINSQCKQRQNLDDTERCQACGTPLLINGKFHLIQPLRPLSPYGYIEVFEAVDESGNGYRGVWAREPGTRVVVKVLKSNSTKRIEMMQEEAYALEMISQHPGLPRSLLGDHFTLTPNNSSLELHCLAMQKFEGQNLAQWLATHGPISQTLALDWLKQLVGILDYVHQADFFHRDIKPDNIIIQPSGEIALIDFGGVRQLTQTYLAKISSVQDSAGVNEPFDVTVLMTAGYTPPEQFNGKALPQSDFFAIGRTFVHLMTGLHPKKLPSDPKTGGLLWREHARHIDKPLADFIDELMAIAPAKRPYNTQVILQRLKRIPLQLKWYRIVRSAQFKAGAISLVVLAGIGVGKGVSLAGANCYFAQGVKAQKANNVELAKADFEQASFLNPGLNLAISSFYFDQASRNESNPELARRNYEMAIKYNPKDIDAYNNLALDCQTLNDLVCAKSNYERVLQEKPNDLGGHFNLGTFYDDQRDYKAAEHHYYLAKKPNNQLYVKALNNLSRLKNIEGDYSKAEKLAQAGLTELTKGSQKELREPKKEASLYKNLGWAELKQKKYGDANRDLTIAKNLDLGRTDTYCLLAQLESVRHINTDITDNESTCLTKNFNHNQPEVYQWREELLQRLRKK